MHGRVQRHSERCRSLRLSSSQPMRPLLPSRHTVAVTSDNHSPPASIKITDSGDSFFKDGRKISVGDCALFKPPRDSPPFIGLIRTLALNKENNLQLGVNWLYRLSDLKLEEGPLVDGAPNEIFYSFHKDKIPAASLLHPCKVAFLPRGVELPNGTSSFICRRAYDIAKQCLWWLTDRDHINEQQQELDQLLYKTRTEMHVTLPPGGRSPKQANGSTSTSQVKPAPDSGQNSGNSVFSQNKGKKRERNDHGGADPVKRDRSSRTNDGDSVQCKTEINLKNEIARITEKGGVVDPEGVEKLVQLMQLHRNTDLLSRTMLASVMASTDKIDCLNRFVQLRGLPILAEWLQDIQKGKIGDGNTLKSGDKSAEEFLLVLLRALDKLPVNLQVLQMCNIGKSVNHLRSHKNVEIHKKARILVDTWKKRVEAEMISIDARSGSTQTTAVSPSKSRLPEASHGGSRTPSGSDVTMKSSISQNSAAKVVSLRFSNGDNNTNYAALSPGAVKPATSIPASKESQPGISVGDAPQTREDRSSSSNHSQNFGQSSSVKEGVKSPTSGSVGKALSSTRNRKNSGFTGISATGSQKDTSSNKISIAHKSSASEKLSLSALTCERVVEGPISERGAQKLIVKIPNRARSPGQDVSENPTFTSSRASSPVLSNKHEHSDHASMDKRDTYQCKVASETVNSPAILPDEEQSTTTEEFKKITDGLPANQSNSFKLHASSFSPMNALIESCVKYPEATSSLSLEDDVGMNLLASVAAGEMSRSVTVSPTDSTERSIHAVEQVCTADEAKSKPAPEDDGKKQVLLSGCSLLDNGLHLSKHAPLQLSSDGKCVTAHSFEDVAIGEGIKDLASSGTDLRSNPDLKLETGEMPNGMTEKASPISTKKARDGELNGGIRMENTNSNNIADTLPNHRSGGTDVMVAEEKDSTHHLSTDECKPMVEDAGSDPLDKGDCNKVVHEKLNRTSSSEQKLSAAVKSEISETVNCEKKLVPAGDAVKLGELDDGDANNCMSKCESLNFEKEVDKKAAVDGHFTPVVSSSSHDLSTHLIEAKVENQEITVHTALTKSTCPGLVDLKAEKEAGFIGCISGSIQPNKAGKCAPMSADSGAKLRFDLNERFSADDGKYRESASSTSSGSTTVSVINPLPFSAHSITSGNSTSVTITAAAKGPFVPPGDLLRGRVELGWKGSAATSAFRPAEPRNVLETPPAPMNSSSLDVSTSKHDRIPLDIDLNVPDERVLAEMASRGSALAVDSTNDAESNRGLDLDLNRVDEANDMGHCSTSGNHGPVRRDFDLNNGPVVDDASAEQFPFVNQLAKSGISIMSQLPPSGLRMNSPVLGSFSSWYPPGNAYSTVSIPQILPDRGEQPFSVYPPQRTFGPAGVSPYNPDVYRESVLSSSPAVPYPSSHFRLPVFPFPSATFSVGADSSSARSFAPPINAQYMGPVGSQFQRPYMVSLPGISTNGMVESNRQWVGQGLDLNTGPGAMESEVREMLPLSSGQHTIVSSQVLTEDQARMFSVSGGLLKRQEPNGGWDSETFIRKQSSWQ